MKWTTLVNCEFSRLSVYRRARESPRKKSSEKRSSARGATELLGWPVENSQGAENRTEISDWKFVNIYWPKRDIFEQLRTHIEEIYLFFYKFWKKSFDGKKLEISERSSRWNWDIESKYLYLIYFSRNKIAKNWLSYRGKFLSEKYFWQSIQLIIPLHEIIRTIHNFLHKIFDFFS